MPVRFERSTITIPAGTVGRFVATDSVSFGSTVEDADVAINGFQVEYDNGLARNFANLEMDPDIGLISGTDTDVEFEIEVELADKNGGESYHGFVAVVVIAQVA